MTSIKDRLKQVRTHFNLTIREFSKEIYFSHGVYGQVEHGTREPNERIIQLISSKFSINKDWIKTGKGEMFLENSSDFRLEKILEIYSIIDNTLKDCLLEQSKILLKIHRRKS